MDRLLYELVFLGSIIDDAGVVALNRSLEHTAILVELPAGCQMEAFPACAILPQRQCVSSPTSFVTKKSALKIGMARDFECARFDGTCTGPVSRVPRNAYDRLCFVVQTLVSEKQDRNKNERGRKLSSQQAFNVLHAAIDSPRVSFKTLWSFINVMFWQLSNLDHESCVLTSTMMAMQVGYMFLSLEYNLGALLGHQ